MKDPAAFRASLEALRDQPDALIRIIVQQAALITELERRLHDLDDQQRGLRARVEEAERRAARQAAPFRLDPLKRVRTPRRPGRPGGHAGAWRRVPEHIDARVAVPLPACPTCGGAVTHVRPRVQYLEDLPPVRPYVTQLTTYVGYCCQCAHAVASTHPLQVSTASGAAGVHLGPRALALAAELNKHLGLTLRTTCRVLATVGGLRVTPGGLVHGLARLARRLAPAYGALQTTIRGSPTVHSDETSWWVGGPGAWLWVFATPTATLYRIAAQRGRTVLLDTLGPAYDGVLVSDCLAIYDGAPARQQKCYAHHLRAVRTALAPTHPYAQAVTGLLHRVLALCAGAPAGPHERAALEAAADAYFTAPRRDPAEETVRQRFAKQRDHLFTCLDVPGVPPTNNLAERQLRPAVIARKLSCGNKTPRGAHTWEVLTSLAATCRQRGESFLDLAAHAARLPAR